MNRQAIYFYWNSDGSEAPMAAPARLESDFRVNPSDGRHLHLCVCLKLVYPKIVVLSCGFPVKPSPKRVSQKTDPCHRSKGAGTGERDGGRFWDGRLGFAWNVPPAQLLLSSRFLNAAMEPCAFFALSLRLPSS